MFDPSESDQERSHRLFAENYSCVAGEPDLASVSTANLERARAFAEQVRAKELRKGWGGDPTAVNRPLVDGLERELEHFRWELAKRYAQRDARHAAIYNTEKSA